MTYRPRFAGYLHGLLLLMRTQRRFEEYVIDTEQALSDVLLYGSADTQEAALGVLRSLGAAFGELGTYKRVSPAMGPVVERLSLELGKHVVAWRSAAVADLGG